MQHFSETGLVAGSILFCFFLFCFVFVLQKVTLYVFFPLNMFILVI